MVSATPPHQEEKPDVHAGCPGAEEAADAQMPI